MLSPSKNPNTKSIPALWPGGAVQQLHNYEADKTSMYTNSTCNNSQNKTGALLPGLFLLWCMKCRKCVGFTVMKDAESPRTAMEFLYAHCPSVPGIFQLDNACNLMAFLLNREPEWFSHMQLLIDEPHFRGHTKCSDAYNTGALA